MSGIFIPSYFFSVLVIPFTLVWAKLCTHVIHPVFLNVFFKNSKCWRVFFRYVVCCSLCSFNQQILKFLSPYIWLLLFTSLKLPTILSPFTVSQQPSHHLHTLTVFLYFQCMPYGLLGEKAGLMNLLQMTRIRWLMKLPVPYCRSSRVKILHFLATGI